MKPFIEFLKTGKPVFGIRCTSLSFRYDKDSPSTRFEVGNGGTRPICSVTGLIADR